MMPMDADVDRRDEQTHAIICANLRHPRIDK
jgi:hypothetical protein